MKYAKLLSDPVNFAVVQLPERRYPGVVIQGDTLNAVVAQLNRMHSLLLDGDLEELESEIDDMNNLLSQALDFYHKICGEKQ